MLICDTNELYAAELGSYVMNHFRNVEMTIFTSTESFFADEGKYDVGILSEEFIEVSSFKKSGSIDVGYILSEERQKNNTDNVRTIYKYRPMNEVIGDIKELKESRLLHLKNKDASTSFFTGIYSPVNHELLMPFAMSLCKAFREKGTVLFVDLEELSLIPALIGEQGERNISDYLYFISVPHDNRKTEDYISTYYGIDYFQPFNNPEELCDIDKETWQKFFAEIGTLGYDNVVVLMGNAMTGFSSILDGMDQMILLGKTGDYYQKSMDAFMRYARGCELMLPLISVQLPMTAANLTDGTYRMDELMSGNLGLFVRKLLLEGNIKAAIGEGELVACG